MMYSHNEPSASKLLNFIYAEIESQGTLNISTVNIKILGRVFILGHL